MVLLGRPVQGALEVLRTTEGLCTQTLACAHTCWGLCLCVHVCTVRMD